MTVDPFAPAAATASASSDPFLDPSRGNFPKIGELLHKLLIMVPVEVTQTTKPNSNELQDRWSINTTVINEDGTHESYDEMYWSQTSIVAAAKKAYREKRPMLGTLHLFPVLNSNWYRVLVGPFITMFVALFKLTWLVSKWMTLGAFAVYRLAFVALRKKFAPRVA